MTARDPMGEEVRQGLELIGHRQTIAVAPPEHRRSTAAQQQEMRDV